MNATKRAFSKGVVDQFSRLQPSDWSIHRLDLRVTKEGLERALQLVNDLVRLVEANGGAVQDIEVDRRKLIGFFVDDERIRIKLTEAVRGRHRDLTPEDRRDHERYPHIRRREVAYVYDPTNRFTFEIENWTSTKRRWTDTKSTKIEDGLEEIVFGLRAAAGSEKRRRVEAEAQRQLEWEQQRRRWKQQERIDRLKRNMSSWEEAQRIRAYLAAVREKAISQEGELNEGSPKSRFLVWAERYAESLDPTDAPASLDWADEFWKTHEMQNRRRV